MAWTQRPTDEQLRRAHDQVAEMQRTLNRLVERLQARRCPVDRRLWQEALRAQAGVHGLAMALHYEVAPGTPKED